MPFIQTLEHAANTVINPVSGFIWNSILTYLLLGAGVLFTIVTRGLQFRLLAHMASLVFTEKGRGADLQQTRAQASGAGRAGLMGMIRRASVRSMAA